MTQDYSQPFNPLQWGGIDQTPIEPPAPLHWRTFRLPQSDPDVALYGQDGVIGFEFKIDDLRGGMLQVGDYARGSNLYDGDYRGTSRSTLDTRWRRHLLLPPLTVQDTTFPASPNYSPLLWCYVKGELYIACGPYANHCLFYEYLSWGMREIPYTPGGEITALGPITIGGVSAGERIFIGRQSLPPQIISDNTGAGLTTMHASLAGAYGILTTPANATTPGTQSSLIYAANAIWSLPITANVADPPTRVLYPVTNGGCAIGIFQMPKGPYGLRAFWAFPLSDVAGSVYALGYSYVFPLRIVHTNLEGTDPVEVDMGMPMLRFVTSWQNKLVGSDGTRVVSYDGEELRDLGILNNRYPNSDLKRNVTGLLVKGRDLAAAVAHADVTALPGAAGQSVLQLEEYVPEMDAWLTASGSMPLGDLSACSSSNSWIPTLINGNFHNQGPSIPWSKRSFQAYLQMANNHYWDYNFQGPSRHNPFYLYRQTTPTGAFRTMAQDFEAQGSWLSPYWELPQLEGRWKRADQVVFMGDVDAGGNGRDTGGTQVGTPAQVGVSLNGGTPIPFYAGQLGGPQVVQTSDTGDDGLWMQLQVGITAQRDNSLTTKTPNCLPLMIRGRAYLTDPTTQVLGLPPGP